MLFSDSIATRHPAAELTPEMLVLSPAVDPGAPSGAPCPDLWNPVPGTIQNERFADTGFDPTQSLEKLQKSAPYGIFYHRHNEFTKMVKREVMNVKNTDATEKKSKLERIEQRISQLEKQKKAIQARENEKKRKARTRRLIQIGAIAIKYLDCPGDIEPEDFEKRIKVLIDGIPKGMGHE